MKTLIAGLLMANSMFAADPPTVSDSGSEAACIAIPTEVKTK